jgi:hypothetical protein
MAIVYDESSLYRIGQFKEPFKIINSTHSLLCETEVLRNNEKISNRKMAI